MNTLWYIAVQVFIKDLYIKNSRKLLIFGILWIICKKKIENTKNDQGKVL